MRIETIRTGRDFQSLGEQWDRVLAASAQDGPFLRHHWLETWWGVYGHGSLAVLACLEGDRLVGAMPMYTAVSGHLPPARIARFIGDDQVGSTGLTPFALPEAEDQVFSELARRVRRHDAGWDMVDLRFMDRHVPFFRLLYEGPGGRASDDCGACPRLALPSDWDGYLGTLSKHRRHEVRRSKRRVDERDIELEVVREPSDLPEAVDDFLRLHELRMRTKFGPEYTVSERYAAFTTRVMSTLLAEDRLRLMFLRFPDRRVAALYLFRYGDTMYAEQSGFDECDAKQDVFRTLWSHAIQGAIEEGCETLDMLLGEQRYKSEWGAKDLRYLSSLRAYSTTPLGWSRRVHDRIVGWGAEPGRDGARRGGGDESGLAGDQREQPSAEAGL